MIGKLAGRVDSISADHVILDVAGVGYLVHCPTSTLSRLAAGANASLSIETKVGNDAIRLYGFSSVEERDWFRLLQTVQGVGARVALSVLSALSVRELERAAVLGDKAAVGRAPGVGAKLAQRIVSELKDKAPSILLKSQGGSVGANVHVLTSRTPESDAIAALVKLGYTQSTAAEAVVRAGQNLGDAPLDSLIKESLRHLAR
ncbi:MAG: Holliday junction branch migration protein RuvA [Alphaproteobacteria bacterium]